MSLGLVRLQARGLKLGTVFQMSEVQRLIYLQISIHPAEHLISSCCSMRTLFIYIPFFFVHCNPRVSAEAVWCIQLSSSSQLCNLSFLHVIIYICIQIQFFGIFPDHFSHWTRSVWFLILSFSILLALCHMQTYLNDHNVKIELE